MPDISVIICTHNPRSDYLQRTLDALKAQTLAQEQWELLLIDNASEKALATAWDLSWHLHARHVYERELGLTPARLRGIRESTGDLLVFVDDDNVLASGYLSAAAELFASRTDLGVASGRLLPEYETPPPGWFRPYESWIAVRRFQQSRWSNFFDPRAEPCGAGMCLRRPIAINYAKKSMANSRQQILGRRGTSLLSGEDVAITKVAIDLGYSMGQFTGLNAIHLIPSRRVAEKYLFDLYRNLQASGKLMGWLDNPDHQPAHFPDGRVLLKTLFRFLKGGNIDRRLVVEEFRATRLARQVIKEAAANQAATGTGALKQA
jgi:glycosyltransferase involved in cell wall biosynthesis